MKKSPTLKIWLSLIYLYLAWGSTYVVLRIVVKTLPPLFTSGTRTFMAGIVLFFLGKMISKDKFPSKKVWIQTGIIGVLLITIANGFVSLVAKWVPSGFSAMTSSLVPIWIALLQWFWGKRPNLLTVIGLVLGLVGVFILVTINNIALTGFEDKFILGIILLLISGLSWALGVMLQTRAAIPFSSFTISGMQLIVGGTVTLLLSFVFDDFKSYQLTTISSFFSLPEETYFGFFYLLLFGSIGGFAIFNWVSQQANPSLVSTYTYVNPLVAIVLGNLLVGEAFHARMLIAGVFIVASVVTVSISKK